MCPSLPVAEPLHTGAPNSGPYPDQVQDCLRRALAAPVYELAKRTPLDEATRLSERVGTRLWLKREDLQPTFSFKLRGAYNCIRKMSDEQRSRGVIAASAGNHAQGVALSARELGVRATIFMPRTTPDIKVQAVAALGANIELVGDDSPAERHVPPRGGGATITYKGYFGAK